MDERRVETPMVVRQTVARWMADKRPGEARITVTGGDDHWHTKTKIEIKIHAVAKIYVRLKMEATAIFNHH